MMEVDDKIMPLPNFRVKPKKWKSSSSIQYTAHAQQQHNMHMGPMGVHDNRSIPASRRLCNGLGSVVAPAAMAASEVAAAASAGARVFTPEEERRRRALLLMRRQGLLITR